MWSAMTTTSIFRSNMKCRSEAKNLCDLLNKNGIEYEYNDDAITIKVRGVTYNPRTFDELKKRILRW